MTHAQIGGQEGIRVAQRPHGDVLRGPGADARQGEQPGPRFVSVGARVEHQVAARQRLRESEQSAAARGGHRQLGGVDAGQGRGRGERARHGADRPRHRRSVVAHQPAGQRGGAGQRHLLAEHGSHRQLVGVDVAGHPPSGRLCGTAGREPGPHPAPRPPREGRNPGRGVTCSAGPRRRGRAGPRARVVPARARRPDAARPSRRREAAGGCAGRRPRPPPPPRARRGDRERRSAPRRRGEPGRAAAGPPRRCARRAPAAGRAGRPGWWRRSPARWR